jgi:hypothetical protein
MDAASYINQQPVERQQILTAIHQAILSQDSTVTASVEPMMGKEMIQYKARGMFKYGLSSVQHYISLHLLPIYGSPVLHEKYQALLPLAKFQKGCINFSSEAEMPLAVVQNLIRDCSLIDLLALRQLQLASKKKK